MSKRYAKGTQKSRSVFSNILKDADASCIAYSLALRNVLFRLFCLSLVYDVKGVFLFVRNDYSSCRMFCATLDPQ